MNIRYGAILIVVSTWILPAWPQGAHNLIRNGDFERWAGDDPVGWETTSIPKVCVVVSASRQAYEGRTAAQLVAKECFGSIMPGMITQKKVKIQPGEYQMKFWYKLEQVGGDVGYVTMEFRNREESTIRVCEERLTKSDGAWVAFAGTFPAPDGAASADLRVALLAGKDGGSLHAGTTLHIDGMVLTEVVQKKGTSGP
jgi:hypothetical protein